MLEVTGLVLTGAEVKKINNNVPREVDVNVRITKIQKTDDRNVVLEFSYQVDYLPKTGMLKLTGVAYCKDTAANVRNFLAAYKKKKEIPMEYAAVVMNMINANAGMNSVFITRPFNLLPPFMPPPITAETQTKKKKKKK